MEKLKEVLRKIVSTLFVAAVIFLVVAALGIAFGFITQRQFVLSYAFLPNFIVAALIIAVGVIGPPASKGVVDFIRIKAKQHTAIVTDETYIDYMDARKQKQSKGREILWVGITCALITGITEIILWLVL